MARNGARNHGAVVPLTAPQEAYDAAIFHFKQILKKNPAHFTAMAQLVQLLRRAGRVGDCAAELAAAEAAMPKVATEAGFHFCKGLQARCAAAWHRLTFGFVRCCSQGAATVRIYYRRDANKVHAVIF